MSLDTLLKDKVILVVDDEPDVLEAIADELDMCIIHKAQDYNTALESITMYTYDVVILDIMGVNFDAYCPCAYTGSPENLHKTWSRIFSAQRKDGGSWRFS